MKVTVTENMMQNVVYQEYREPNRVTLGHEGGEAKRTLTSDWDQVDPLVKDVLGRVTASGTDLQLIAPHWFPSTDQCHYLADEVEWHGIGYNPTADPNWTNVKQHLKAVINVTFHPYPTLNGNILQTDWIQYLTDEDYKPAAEFRTLPTAKLFWDTAKTLPLDPDEAPGALDFTAEWIYTLRRMPFIPAGVLEGGTTAGLIGTTNSVAHTSRRYGVTFAIGTLLWGAPDVTAQTDCFGNAAYTLAYHLFYRPSLWNKAFASGSTTAAVIYNDAGTAFNQYPPKDWSAAFLTLG